MSLFEELKRRNVFRVAIAYLAGGWLLIQIVETILPAFGLGDFGVRITVIVLAVGLIPTLIIAWVFELTPDGLKKESDVERGQSSTPQTRKKLDGAIMLVLALALGYFTFDKFVLDPARDVEIAQTAARAGAEQALQEALNAGSSDHSIAVLPFVNMSDDASNEYFSDGLSEELLNLLARIPELRVAARTSSFSYKGKDTIIAQIGAELNVAHVLEGSVRKSDNRIRITAQLIKTRDGFHVWSKTYDRILDDIFVTQDEIAAAVVDALRVTLLGELPEQRQTDPEVYTLYLQGKYFSRLGGRDNAQRAVQSLKQALAIDPEYAPAWSSLRFPYVALVRYGDLPRDEGVALALEALEKALELDDQLVAAWAGLAWLKRTYFWDWQGARMALDKALQIEPNNASTIGSAGSIASTFGEFDKAIELFERNVKSNPLSWTSLNALGQRYRTVGRFDEARAVFERVVALNPEYRGAHLTLASVYLFDGRPEEVLTRLTGLPDSSRLRQIKAAALFDLGETNQAQQALEDFLQSPSPPGPAEIANMYAWRGENDEAFEWLAVALEQRDTALAHILGNSALVKLKDDARFPILLEKIGLRDAWEAMPAEYGGPAK